VARGTPATAAAERSGIAFRVHEYAHARGGTGYGAEAAGALGVDAARVFKTLVVALSDGSHAVAVVPVAGTLDPKALAEVLGAKTADLADARDAQRLTGYVLGGISPLGQRRALPTVVDETAAAFDTVFVSGGRRGLELELAPADLVQVTNATVAAIGRP
jgi:Cys-tRNA(Pro)/Cys-tRNA(Cys) deacylase